jgi:CheY-like chemotaxis protein/two-component sensor histidine kinase
MNLRKANVKLQHAMRVKDEFLATMSHELRTPLNGILGTSEILLTGYRGPLNDRQIQLVSTIDASGHHLLSLINDILDLSKIEADKFELHLEPVSIRDLCQSCLAFIKESASKKNIMVNFAVDPAVTIIEADARRLKQILVNLLSNAVKFTPTQGKVTLDISPSHEQGFVEFSISDTGIGISQADQKRLFTAFTQLDNSLTRNYEGTGLGLALVKRLTELHGGRITVKSEVGVGSQFIIQLPWHGLFADQVASEADVDMAADVTALVSEVKSKATILLVEDNLTNIMMISDYLDAMGYSLVYAHDGYEALEKAAENSPDLILMDIQMPKLDGFEATRRLRANPQFAVTPIIALTAHAMVGDRERCLEAGANDYMSKPVNLKVLLKMIQTYLS